MIDDELLKIFGLNVKFERIKRDISQDELAQITGFSTTYISNVECAKHNISLINAYKFSKTFEKSLDYMIKKPE